jgi:hypothetical protein
MLVYWLRQPLAVAGICVCTVQSWLCSVCVQWRASGYLVPEHGASEAVLWLYYTVFGLYFTLDRIATTEQKTNGRTNEQTVYCYYFKQREREFLPMNFPFLPLVQNLLQENHMHGWPYWLSKGRQGRRGPALARLVWITLKKTSPRQGSDSNMTRTNSVWVCCCSLDRMADWLPFHFSPITLKR